MVKMGLLCSGAEKQFELREILQAQRISDAGGNNAGFLIGIATLWQRTS
jgi:hypothetical protein